MNWSINYPEKRRGEMTEEQNEVEALLLEKILEASSYQDRAFAVEAYYRFREICRGDINVGGGTAEDVSKEWSEATD